ncbi:MAG TPA: hypothetical protein PKC54_13810 [Ferruginibacter sp.]|nr:hypothetical protein [Ferruginibacter sp.]
MKLKQQERVANHAIKMLRKHKHALGFPFMINTKDLPDHHCYLEYPDGHINLVTIRKDKTDFEIVAELTLEQSNLIRKKYKIG